MYYIILVMLCLFLLNYDKMCKRYRNKRDGKAGESKVKQQLAHLSTDYQVINDYRLCGSQIDHIVKKGNLIYVIETKNWNGVLEGNAFNKYLYLNNKKIYSPFMQNKKHCLLVKQFLLFIRLFKLFSIV